MFYHTDFPPDRFDPLDLDQYAYEQSSWWHPNDAKQRANTNDDDESTSTDDQIDVTAFNNFLREQTINLEATTTTLENNTAQLKNIAWQFSPSAQEERELQDHTLILPGYFDTSSLSDCVQQRVELGHSNTHVWTKSTLQPFQLEVNSVDDSGNVLCDVDGNSIKKLAPRRVCHCFQTIITLTGDIVHL